jgi:hypothetical protein
MPPLPASGIDDDHPFKHKESNAAINGIVANKKVALSAIASVKNGMKTVVKTSISTKSNDSYVHVVAARRCGECEADYDVVVECGGSSQPSRKYCIACGAPCARRSRLTGFRKMI